MLSLHQILITLKLKVMKKVFLTLALAGTLFLSSCIGSFNLTKMYYNFNNSIGSKWINELVFFASICVPIYEVCTFADAVVFNTIEFWTGSNPVGSKTEVINTENGKYIVESNDNGYTITKGDETVQFVNDNGVWYVQNGEERIQMFSYIDGNHVCMNLGETSTVVELSQEGVSSFRAELAE